MRPCSALDAIATLLGLFALAQLAACAGMSTPPTAPANGPGLGEIMSFTQMRHLKLWFAGAAGNWELADYEADELAEGFDDAMRFHPQHKNSPRPLTELIPEFTGGPLQALRQAIDQRDRSRFEVAYDALTAGCNGCHAAAQFSFNIIVRPTANPYSNQQFTPRQ